MVKVKKAVIRNLAVTVLLLALFILISIISNKLLSIDYSYMSFEFIASLIALFITGIFINLFDFHYKLVNIIFSLIYLVLFYLSYNSYLVLYRFPGQAFVVISGIFFSKIFLMNVAKNEEDEAIGRLDK